MVRFKSVLRFSLRGFLVALTIFGVWLGMEANEAHRKRRIARAVTAAGGQIIYLHHEVGTGDEIRLDFELDPPGPLWLHELVGPDYFQEPRQIALGNITDEWLTEHIGDISRLKKVNTLSLRSSAVSSEALACLGRVTRLETLLLQSPTFDAALAKFDGLTNLKVLSVRGPGVTDSGLAHIVRLEKLEGLALLDTRVSDRGLQELARLPNLKHLHIGGARITDTAIRHLGTLPNLQSLGLSGTRITDIELRRLESLRNLQILTLRDVQATAGGIDRLYHALPQCEVRLPPN